MRSTGADCLKIKESDLVIVNGEERLGAGTAQELVIAKYFQKPVITVLPKDSYHRKSNVVFEGILLKIGYIPLFMLSPIL